MNTLSLLIAAICAVATPVQQATQPGLTAETKAATVEALVKNLNERYIYPETARKIEKALRDWTRQPAYAALDDGAAFAAGVDAILKANVTDAHLRFRYSPRPLPPRADPTEPSAEEMRRMKEMIRNGNAGFNKVERLRGNVGYIEFQHFAAPEDMARPLEGAIRFLADCDAMIVDLRRNGGGHPAGVQLFCSYLFGEKPVHLNDIYFRRGDKIEKTEFWTLKEVAGPRLPSVPLFVLTSKQTGSGAEECAYNFQQLKRGTIVGESTWGGANPGGVVRLGDHFSCFIPSGRAENPHSKKNWEGTGVIPDVKVESAKALDEAHALALKTLDESKRDAERLAWIEEVLTEISRGI